MSIKTEGQAFSLTGPGVSYIFHADESGELVHDHFGPSTQQTTPDVGGPDGGWGSYLTRIARELPDSGRGDFRLPAIKIRKANRNTIVALKYQSHEVVPGKPGLPGLPATFGRAEDASTVIVKMHDDVANITVDVSYSIFPGYNAIVRSMKITNGSQEEVSVEHGASFTVDMPSGEWEMMQLSGDWAREARIVKRPVVLGTQG
jgi:alpha-galactosidase